MNHPSSVWTLITVTHNSAEPLKRYWSSVRLPEDVGWVVVDNGSTDDTVRIARELGAEVIEAGRNLGFGRANNLGMAHSHTPYVAFVNPDVTVDPATLPRLATAIDAERALVAPQLLHPDGTAQPNGRGWPILLHKVWNRLSPGRVNGTYRLFAAPGEQREAVWLTGAVVASTREVMQSLGPWDESFFLYYEDTDLCVRARDLGIRSLLIGDVRWTHGWDRATARFNRGALRAWRREVASMLRFYRRYPRLVLSAPAEASRAG